MGNDVIIEENEFLNRQIDILIDALAERIVLTVEERKSKEKRSGKRTESVSSYGSFQENQSVAAGYGGTSIRTRTTRLPCT